MKKTILLISLFMTLTSSCKKTNEAKDKEEKSLNRKYEVRLSNHIGSDWYECDSININGNILQLKNNEDSLFFVKMVVPDNVLVRIYNKKMIKEKKCSGINKATSYKGCGKLTQFRKYGLCSSCYPTWLYSTDVGKLVVEKASLKAKKQIEIKRKKDLSEQKEKLKSIKDFKNDLQREINTIVRLIDKDCVCPCTLKKHTSNDSGHVYSRGSTPELAFNLNNIYLQSVYANQHLSGDPINFFKGLETIYGKEHKDFVYCLKGKFKPFKPTKEEIKEYIKTSRQIVKELKSLDLTYSPEHRLRLRNEYNKRIGIYTE